MGRCRAAQSLTLAGTSNAHEPLRSRDPSRYVWLAGLALWLGGCGDDSNDVPPDLPDPGTGGAAPASCPPGETPLDDGSCLPAGATAGTPAEECAAGFVPGDTGGCAAQIVAEPCGAGQIALPGETACHELSPCGSEPWADVADDSTAEFVDATFSGTSNGSRSAPWVTIAQALDAAAPGATIALAAGTYAEDLRIEGKAVRLQGRCPSMVTIEGAGVQPAAISVVATAGVELAGLSVTGPRMGIWVLDSNDAKVDETRVYDAEGIGLAVRGSTSRLDAQTVLIETTRVAGLLVEGAAVQLRGSAVRAIRSGTDDVAGYGMMVQEDRVTGEPGSLTVRSSVVERCRGTGVMCLGANLDLEGVLVRDTASDLGGNGSGVGVGVDHDAGGVAQASLRISASEILRSVGYGVVVHGGEATIEATSLRDVAEHPVDDDRGWGIALLEHQDRQLSVTGSIARSLVEGSHGAGVYAMGGSTTIEQTIVRATRLTQANDHGRGVELNGSPTGLSASQGTVRSSVISQNHEVGLMAAGLELTVESTAVRQTLPNVTEGAGYGLELEYDTVAGARVDAHIRWCLVESNVGAGLIVAGSDALIESTLVKDTQLRPTGSAGVGIAVQLSREVDVGSVATVRNCRVEDSHETGILGDGSRLTVEATEVVRTEPDDLGRYGDCIGIRSYRGLRELTSIRDSLLGDCRRSGLASFGTIVELAAVTLDCNPIHLNGEPRYEFDFTVTDLGGNTCGCGEASEDCRVLSTGLEAPEPVY
ncbi:MAG: right-handed parallel beta-helix repeat-containing protein [Deltaproteobacteria bacterium]|jgi:hypothetical protein|nr:right-handed parallel beta-helix repeat-containing protein [Deltaproteobacteria bacterium]MBW2534626.1 right-handed parallel beta-helix repeat-containing protein [Deltaproteobacteria bacterium]